LSAVTRLVSIDGPAEPKRQRQRNPPDFINFKVEEPVGDQPFEDLDSYMGQDELQALSEGL
jgi:5-methylphenazine-1-carboxylate 1-monooxygenase